MKRITQILNQLKQKLLMLFLVFSFFSVSQFFGQTITSGQLDTTGDPITLNSADLPDDGVFVIIDDATNTGTDANGAGYRAGTPGATSDRNYTITFQDSGGNPVLMNNVQIDIGFINNDVLNPIDGGLEGLNNWSVNNGTINLSHINVGGEGPLDANFNELSTVATNPNSGNWTGITVPAGTVFAPNANSFDAASNGTLTITSTADFSSITFTFDYLAGNNPFGIVLSELRYSVAPVAPPTDTDGDLIPDSVDLDDDNDGILDTEEGYLCTTTNAIQNPSAQSGMAGWTEGGLNHFFAQGVANRFFVNNPQFGMSSISQTIPAFDNNGNIELTFRAWVQDGDHQAGGTARMNVLFNGVSYFEIFNPSNQGPTAITVSAQNGATFTGPNTMNNSGGFDDALFTVSIPSSETSGTFEFRVDVIGGSKNDDGGYGEIVVNNTSCTDTDTDGDNTPDHLDTDSDNDGCSDANEAYADANADGGDDEVFGLGTPTVDANGLVTGPIAAAYNTGVVPAVTDNAVATACVISLDTDGDQVPDNVDLDDDNDGILDTNECPPVQTDVWTIINPNGLHAETALGNGITVMWDITTGNPGFSITNGQFNPAGNNIASQLFWNNAGVAGANSLQYAYAFGETLTISFVDTVTGNPVIVENPIMYVDRIGGFAGSIPNAATVTLLGGLTWTELSGTLDFTTTTTTAVDQSALNASGANPSESNWNIVGGTASGTLQINGSVSQFSMQMVQTGPAGIGDGIEMIFDVQNLNAPICDFDGDNIPNHFDLDSDNDGIYDVIEAGGTDTNTDGLADDDDDNADNTTSNGIPTSAGTGTTPIETTLGTPNYLNTDSDNDGCSDANEAYVNANTDGGDDEVFGLGTPTVDANGLITGPIAATYTTGVVPAVVDNTDQTGCIIDDGDGVDIAIENAGPNGGDANNDGILDSLQANVASITDATGSGDYVTLEITGTTCNQILNINAILETDVASLDPLFDYPIGLIDFTLSCTNVGESAAIVIYWHGLPAIDLFRKYGSTAPGANDATYAAFTATMGTAVINGITVPTTTYSLIDGAAGDESATGAEIVDPVGPAISDDVDGDGVPNADDICPGNDDNADADGDGVPDGCDLDDDNDGIPDYIDNPCEAAFTFNQTAEGWFTTNNNTGIPESNPASHSNDPVTGNVGCPINIYGAANLNIAGLSTTGSNYIVDSDPSGGAMWLRSPNFGGLNLSNALGGIFRFDSYNYRVGFTGNPVWGNTSAPITMQFAGTDGTVVEATAPINYTNWENGIWNTFNIVLDDATWTVIAGSGNLTSVLASIQNIRLRMEFINGGNTGNCADVEYFALDNIVFTGPGVCDTDTDNDGIPDQLDLDADNDGIYDVVEAGLGSFDTNNDGLINALDTGFIDANGDGLDDRISLLMALDTDSDGIADFRDPDSDNDGCSDADEAYNDINTDADDNGYFGSGTPPTNSDGTVTAASYNPSNVANSIAQGLDTDLDGIADFCDEDDDNDGNPDISDPNPLQPTAVDDSGTTDINTPVTIDIITNDDYLANNDPNNTNPITISNTGTGTAGGTVTFDPNTGEVTYTPLSSEGGTDVTIIYEVCNDILPLGLPAGLEDVCTQAIITIIIFDDTDGDQIPDNIDVDDDNDGIADVNENPNGVDPSADDDNDGIPNYLDDDPANPLVGNDNGEIEPGFDFDNDGIPNHFDIDSDNDGIFDVVETGNGNLDTDNDGDVDIDDAVFADTNNDGQADNTAGTVPTNTDGNANDGPDFLDIDADDDGIPDNVEAQPTIGYTEPSGNDLNNNGIDDAYEGVNVLDPEDTDGDNTPDYLDVDSDDDGVDDVFEGGQGTFIGTDVDGDGLDDGFDEVNTVLGDPFDVNDEINDPTDGTDIQNSDNDTDQPDYRDIDDDNDTVNTEFENPDPNGDGNPDDAQDTDGDNTPDYLDLDDDGDTVNTEFENPDPNGDGNPDDAQDTDGDNTPDYLDLDDDGDTVNTEFENPDPNGDGNPDDAQDTDGDNTPDYLDLDDDGDTVNTEFENPDPNGDGNPDDAQDTDGDNIPDYLDMDDDGDGIPTDVEGADPNGDGNPDDAVDTDGDNVPDYLDNDSDNDGIPDSVEAGDDPLNPVDTDGDGIPDFQDIDSDNDGILDADEAGDDPTNPTDSDGDNIPDYNDLDSDNDGTPDVTEAGGDDPDGDGIIGVGPITDTDGDGFSDIVDSDNGGIPLENPDTDNDGVNDVYDLDSDNDGIPDVTESGGDDPDGDGVIGTGPITDTDNDGISDIVDLDDGGTLLPNPDTDGDNVPDNLDIDSDNDGIVDAIEAGGDDPDGDGVIGTGPIVDTDGDGLSDVVDPTTGGLPLANEDSDGDSLPDALDLDSDNDGITDNVESQSTDGYILPSGNDLNANGLDDAYDVDPINPEDTDGDNIPDYLDDDSDNDNVPDAIEGHDLDHDGVADNLPIGDSDGDGLDDAYDGSIGDYEDPNGLEVVTDPATDLVDTDGTEDVDYRDGDDDNDGVNTIFEDVDGDGDPTNDDTDGDNTPNYLDIDDDGDSVETEFENPDPNGDGNPDDAQDTDGDSTPDYLDIDDDGDTINTEFENPDPNGDGNPQDAVDSDGDNTPDYLDADDDGDSVETEFENPDPNGDGNPDDAVDSDGDLIPDYLDIDDDGDSVETKFENPDPNGDGNPNDAQDTDGDLIPDYLDIDDDGDSVETEFENPDPNGDGNPNDAQDTDGDLIPDYLDIDDDGDVIDTEFESPDPNGDGNPDDAVDSDGDNTPDYLDLDDDGDTVSTEFENPDPNGDGNPDDAQDSDGDLIPDYLDIDDDNDGVPTDLENPDPNGDGDPSDAQDTDGDNIPDYLDIDDDGDGIDTADEDANGDGDPTNDDADGDGIPNYLDDDSDNDGIPDAVEGLNDTDGDGIPDYLDIDDDNDGIITANEDVDDNDGDLIPDYLDQDSDGDGIPDNVEGQSTEDYIAPSGIDSDGDGLDDNYDNLNNDGIDPVDTDGDGDPDYTDEDSDNDGVDDAIEAFDTNGDGEADTVPSGNDINNNGIDDAFEDGVTAGSDFSDPNGILDSGADGTNNTDGTDEPDFRDKDDDNDGTPTGADDNQDSIDGDCDRDGILDYLDSDSCTLIPNAFTPNGDTENPTFIIPALANAPNFEILIYNRYGNIVYEYKNKGRTGDDIQWWDGFSNGRWTLSAGSELVPVGTYFYVINFNDGEREPVQGWVYVNY